MIPSSVVLAHLGLMAATPTTISQVEAVRDGGRLVITVTGDAMIDPEAATTKMAEGRLYLVVRDARVREANRAWGEGSAEIRAHRHKHEVELVVPLAQTGCQGSVELDRSPGGLRAYVSCDEKVPARARSATATALTSTVAAAAATVPAPRPPSSSDPAPAVRPSARPILTGTALDAAALKAALVLQPPARPVAEKKAEPVAAPARREEAPPAKRGAPLSVAAERTAAATATATPLPTGKAIPTPGPAPTPTLALPPAPAAGPVAADARLGAVAQGGSSGGGSGGMLAGGFLLAGLAAAAFHFTRRRAKSSRYIQIVESASLGPKRSIVVARVGDATMILGTSEAGITLLKSLPEPPRSEAKAPRHVPGAIPMTAAAPDEAVTASFVLTPAPVTASATLAAAADLTGKDADLPELDDIPMDESSPDAAEQGGLLARLFRRDGAGLPKGRPFEELLEDSLEDQELRRKLSLGLAGRTR